MIWWYWVVLGLALTAIELATPGGFFFIFFAVSALLIGLVELVGGFQQDWMQWSLFPVISLACLALFRKPLLAFMQRGDRGGAVDSLVNEVALPTSAIPAGQHGRAELRGTTWNVRNIDTRLLASGERCRVVAVRDLELDIRAERGP
jgi:hypothetical protein